MHLDFDFSNVSIDVNWKEIGSALLSFAGTGFLTLMAFGLVTLTGGSYQPSNTPVDYSPGMFAVMTLAIMALGAFVQLVAYGGWTLAGLAQKGLRRLRVDK